LLARSVSFVYPPPTGRMICMKTRHSNTTFLADAARVFEAVLCPVPVKAAWGGVEDVDALAKRCVR
jgi:hypothetical protein